LRIARLRDEKWAFLEDPQQVIDELKRQPQRIDLFTLIGRLPNGLPELPYAAKMDNLAVLPITTFDHWRNEVIDGKTRNVLRKSEKRGVVVVRVDFDENLLHSISNIYNECPIRQGRQFLHYRKDINTVRKETITFIDKTVFLGAYFDKELIGFAKIVIDKYGNQAGLMQIISMIKHRDKAPNNALVSEAVRVCAERGISYLWYGNYVYGNKGEDSLADFKKYNGFRRIDIPRYYIPLTTFGQIAIRLGLQEQLINRIPAPAINAMRRLRQLWYCRGVSSVR